MVLLTMDPRNNMIEESARTLVVPNVDRQKERSNVTNKLTLLYILDGNEIFNRYLIVSAAYYTTFACWWGIG